MKNVILATFCTAFAVVSYFATLSFPSPAEEYRSPSVYPRSVIVGIVILCVVLVASELLRRRKPEPAAAEAASSARLPVRLLVIMAAYYALMQVVGFCTATFAFLLVTFLVLGGRPRVGVLFSATMTAGQYVLFVVLLEVRMPDPVVAFLLHAL